MNKPVLIKRIAQLVNDKDIEDISDVRDESDRDGMRIVVELKRGDEPQIVLNNLFKHTQMQENFSMILLAIVNGQPREMGIIQTIKYFIEHRVDVVRRRTAYLLRKGEGPRAHPRRLSQGSRPPRQRHHHHSRQRESRRCPRKPGRSISAARRSTSTSRGRAPRVDPEKPFTSRQADAILELQLHRLTKLSIDEISKELKEVRDNIADYESILGSEKKLRAVIIKELEEVKKLTATSAARASKTKPQKSFSKISSPTSRLRSPSATPAT